MGPYDAQTVFLVKPFEHRHRVLSVQPQPSLAGFQVVVVSTPSPWPLSEAASQLQFRAVDKDSCRTTFHLKKDNINLLLDQDSRLELCRTSHKSRNCTDQLQCLQLLFEHSPFYLLIDPISQFCFTS